MNDLDRRIAIEVFGEEEPPKPERGAIPVEPYSDDENWKRILLTSWDGGPLQFIWQPRPFSSSLEEALRAVDIALPGGEADFMAVYERDAKPEKRWHVVHYDFERHGQSLPEAICNLLLALKDNK